jgi:hypothetical protein
MPDYGLTKALLKASKTAKVPRTGAAAEAAQKAATAAPEVFQPVPSTAAANLPQAASPRVLNLGAADAEARRISTLELGDYDLEASHQINFDRLTTADDVKAVIADAAERNKGRITDARRDVISNAHLQALATDLNVDVEVVDTVLRRETGGAIPPPEVVLAARQVLAASANRVLTLGKKIAAGQGTDIERIQLRRQIQFHEDYQTGFMGVRAETGRALNAFNIPVGLELDPENLVRMRSIVDNLNGNDTEELARMISQMESAVQVSRFAKQYTRSRVSGTLQELFINSILSGPLTHVVNATGNALFQGMSVAEYGVAAQIGKILPGSEHVQVGEATAMLYGQLTGWRDAMRYAWLAFKNGESFDAITKFEGHTRRAISSQNLFPKGAPPSVASMVDLVGTTIRIPTERVMVPVDEFFKTMAYRADLSRQAYLEAQRRIAGGAKLSSADLERITRQFLEAPPPAAVKKAEDFARYVTFQSELGVRGRKWQAVANSTPGGFIIAPFIRTPINVFKAGLLERSPLAVFSSDFHAALAKGGPERDLAVARVAMGSLTVAAAAVAVAGGRITGGGPQDPGARRLLEATGWQPYSLVYENPLTGDTVYQSYARAEPLSFIIGTTADMVEIRAYMNADDPLASDNENMSRAIAGVTAAVANNTLSKTFMSGVADFTAALEDPARYMSGWLARSSQAFLPFSAFRRQITKVQDPLIREAWDYGDKLRATAGLAGYSEGLPPKRDVFGEPVEWKGGSIIGALSPFPDSTYQADPIADELVAVMQQTGSIPVTMPSRKIEGMALTVEEYDEFVRHARQEPNLGGGLTFRDRLDWLYGTSTYLLATPDMKAALIAQERSAADAVGRNRLEKENPEFAARLDRHRMKKAELMVGVP